MRTVEYESIQYRTGEMLAASDELIAQYAHYAGIDGTENWPRVLFAVRRIIKNQSARNYEWNMPSISLEFSGFPQTLEQVSGDNIYTSPAPYFEIKQGTEYTLLNARRKTRLARVTQQILESLADVYKLEPAWNNPAFTLRFPKEHYAERIEVKQGVLL